MAAVPIRPLSPLASPSIAPRRVDDDASHQHMMPLGNFVSKAHRRDDPTLSLLSLGSAENLLILLCGLRRGRQSHGPLTCVAKTQSPATHCVKRGSSSSH
jgi:hypothetical protein